ncbi:hypothetical protein M758_UG001400 [Ceratodon purpureus]|nr:hypothetical protein M758_UG001400 [Ceratodon purpureus]
MRRDKVLSSASRGRRHIFCHCVLERDLATCQCHVEAITNLCVPGGRGHRLAGSYVPPKPYFIDGTTTTVERAFLSVRKCVFCGLGFTLDFALMYSSCQHPYHHWCAEYHFSRSEKCIHHSCSMPMRETW